MSDKRSFFHNILNNPYVFVFIRSILDGRQVRYLKRLIKDYNVTSVLDVACGCGLFSQITDNDYLGIDYNKFFISYSRKKFGNKNRQFALMDAADIRLQKSYDTSLIINSIHHFSDKEVVEIFKSMKKSTQRLIIVHDAVQQKNPVSKFFYNLDRGKYFRSIEDQKILIEQADLKIKDIHFFRAFPGVYLHSTIVCSVNK